MLSTIQRLNATVGYIAGWAGTGVALAKTSDAGKTWQRLSVPVSALTSLRFIDEQVGWVAGFIDIPQGNCQLIATGAQPCKGVVLRTDDGGRSWQTALAFPIGDLSTDPIIALQAIDGHYAWALTRVPSQCQSTCEAHLQQTIDGGHTWTTQVRGQITMMRFASANRGWIALADPGEASEVRTTSDGGKTWRTDLRVIDSPFGLDAASISTAWFLTRNGAYCSSSNCDRYALYRTDNGGLNWAFLNNPKGFAVGCSGGHLAGPLFASASRGWLGLNLGAGGANVGPGGLLSSKDGGQSWRCSTTPPNINMISAADPLHLWAAGEDRALQPSPQSALYRSDDGAVTWRAVDLGSLR